MVMERLFMEVLEQERTSAVIFGTDGTILYMNPAAHGVYERHGSYDMIGRKFMDYHPQDTCRKIELAERWLQDDEDNDEIELFYSDSPDRIVRILALRDDDGKVIGYCERYVE